MSFLNFIRKYLCCGKNILCKKAFAKKYKLNPHLYGRIGYIFLFLIAIAYSIFLLLTNDSILISFENNMQCKEQSIDSNYTCLEISSVYRISFAFMLMHFICFLSCLTNYKTINILVQNEIWTLKFMFLCIIYYFSLYISNGIFNKFAMVAKFVSVLYLLYQLILNIYFAHVLNFKLVFGFDNYNSRSNRYRYAIITFTLIFFFISVYFLVLSFFNYENNWYNSTVIFFNIAFGLVNIYISISHFVEDKRLLTSLYIFSYTCYITWSALNSQPLNSIKIQTDISFNVNKNKNFIQMNNFNNFSVRNLTNLTYQINNNYSYYEYKGDLNRNLFIWNIYNNITKIKNITEGDEGNLIIDLTESFFGLFYVLVALIFVGFFSKKIYNGYNPFDSDSDVSNQLDISSYSIEEYNSKEQQILQTCNTLAKEAQFKYNHGKYDNYFYLFKFQR